MNGGESVSTGYIHRFIEATTPEYASDGPTLLLLHGTGGDENDLLELGRLLAPGVAQLSPRGNVLENGMPRFFRRLAMGLFDEDDLKSRTNELADFVTAASGIYKFDPNRVIAAGFSNGANIAASMLLLRPGILSAALLFHPMVPLVPEKSPNLTGTSVFIGAGRSDPIVQPSETERLIELLQRARANVTPYWQNGGHTLGLEEVRVARTWLAALLKPEQ